MMTRRRITMTVAAVATTALLLTGCTESTPSTSAQKTGQAQTESAFAQQQAAVPYPAAQLKDSLERRNLRERLLRTNRPNAIGYVYLMSFGKIIGYYAIKGKVSSTQSQMTTENLVRTNCHNGNGCNESVVNAPGDDGSYGANEAGIFMFTTEGTMVTTNLDYIWSDQPLPVDVPRLNK